MYHEEITWNKDGMTIKDGLCRYCLMEKEKMTDWFCSDECRKNFFDESKVKVVCEIPYCRSEDKKSKMYILDDEETIVIYNAILDEYDILGSTTAGVVCMLGDLLNTFNHILEKTNSKDYLDVIAKANGVKNNEF